MRVVILAGGLGTRLSEETAVKPKPMVEIGGKPILWHLLRIYAAAGFNDFVIALGYKQEVVKNYFRSLHADRNDLTVDVRSGEMTVRRRDAEPYTEDWKVHLVDTGTETQTGGRILRLRELIGQETFLCTYGDGLASIDIRALVRAHRECGREATLSAVRPPARFGGLELEGDRVATFVEKPQLSEGWINGGFFVFEPSVFDRIQDDRTYLEHEPLASLARDGQLTVFRHDGFWQPMDTLRDKRYLEELWASGAAPWAPTAPPARLPGTAVA
jgi:glucose-1-phosphate cytidylyltransferase